MNLALSFPVVKTKMTTFSITKCSVWDIQANCFLEAMVVCSCALNFYSCFSITHQISVLFCCFLLFCFVKAGMITMSTCLLEHLHIKPGTVIKKMKFQEIHRRQWIFTWITIAFKGSLSSQSPDVTTTKVRAHGPKDAFNEDQIKEEVISPTWSRMSPS